MAGTMEQTMREIAERQRIPVERAEVEPMEQTMREIVAALVTILVTILASHFTRFGWVVGLVIILGAGVKEYYFDAKYEKDPPQSFKR